MTTNATVLAYKDRPDQLPLPTRPVLLQGGRRERTDEDRQWYSDLLRDAQHSRLTDKVVFERIAYYASLRPERVAFPSVARLAREVLCSVRTVQYALRRLEADGLIQCVNRRKGGRATGRYHVLELHPRGARAAPEVIKEEDQDLPASVLPFGKTLEPNLKGEKASEKQPALIESTKAKAKDGGRVVRLWYGLQRSLGGWSESFLQEQGYGFARLNHAQKTVVINKLLEEEGQAIEAGYLQARGGQ